MLSTMKTVVSVAAALFFTETNFDQIQDYRVQSEELYYGDNPPIMTCWVSGESNLNLSLNSYFFYYFENFSGDDCAEGLPEGLEYYAFDTQIPAHVALRLLNDLNDWLDQGPDLNFLSELEACRNERRSLDIRLIRIPVLSRKSEIDVSFNINCPTPIRHVRAEIGFSYDEHLIELTAESAGVIWQ